MVFLIGCQRNDEVIDPSSKKVSDYNADVVYAWNKQFISIIKHEPGYRPPIAARALAYIGIAAYEAVAAGMSEHQSIANNISGLSLPKIQVGANYHWGVAINAAYRNSMTYYLQNSDQKEDIRSDSISNSFYKKYAIECDTATFNRSKKFGEAISYAVYLYSLEDNQANAFRNNKPADFVPVKGIDKWRSTPPDFLNALTPTWGAVRTFFLQTSEIQPKAPLVFSTDKASDFYKEVNEVYTAVKNTTTESKWIAEFWSDDLHTYTIDASSRWIAIADAFMKQKNVDLETAIYIDAKLGITLHNAAVVCWNEKFIYNLLRPVSYINDYIEPTWRPILRDLTKPAGQQIGVTPQHPSYPSGHSTFGQAAAEVLINTFGDNINFTDRTHEGETYFDGRPRTFTSFTKMSEENAYSRIPLGVHYRMDCVEGLRIGKIVGQKTNAIKWNKTLQ